MNPRTPGQRVERVHEVMNGSLVVAWILFSVYASRLPMTAEHWGFGILVVLSILRGVAWWRDWP